MLGLTTLVEPESDADGETGTETDSDSNLQIVILVTEREETAENVLMSHDSHSVEYSCLADSVSSTDSVAEVRFPTPAIRHRPVRQRKPPIRFQNMQNQKLKNLIFHLL